MVAPQNEEIFGVHDFVTNEETDRFERLLAPIDIVSQKKVVALGRKAAIFEQPEQIGELTVNVPANLEGGLEFEEHGLR